MNCIKNTKRTLFNLLEIFTCDGCESYIIYEYIYIGKDKINIYRFNKECTNKIKKFNFYKLFLKEMIINDKDLFLIFNNFEFIRYFDYLPILLNGSDLYIFVE